MSHFIKCNTEFVKYRKYTIYNDPINLDLCQSISKDRYRCYPINLDLCQSISKDRYRCYPDNEGLPSIYFRGIEIRWVYNSKTDRDWDFENIVNKWK